MQPFPHMKDDSAYEDGQYEPTYRPYSPAASFHLGLLRYAEQFGLLLAQDELETYGAVDARMADREQEVTLFTNPGLLFRHLVSTPGAGQVSRLSLAERAGGISAASDFKEMEALLSFLCEHIADSHSLQEILPP